MKKNAAFGSFTLPPLLIKCLIIMKLSFLLVLLSVCQLQARVLGQGNITLRLQQTEIEKVLNRIEKTGEFRFLYNYELGSLKKKVDINVENSSLSETLEKLFVNTDLTYKVLDNNLVVVLSGAVANQDIRVTGRVTGSNNEPLASVSVQEKGSSKGTTTNNNGEFAITVPEKAILVFTYIGYAEKEVAVEGQNIVNVQLSPSDKLQDQVVVVGYGRQRRKDVTGAVSVVTAADIANRPIIDPAEALQGKASGVQVISNSGKPGAGLTVRIRGSSSVSAGNEPLYVVDGIPMTDISTFSPNDIESISVLKDAASASIYGTRAANGVVVITTKKGVSGRPKIDFNMYYGSTSTTKKLDVLNAKQYQQYMGDLYNKLPSPQPNPITDSLVNANNINWPDEVFRKGHLANYQLAISGGSDKTQYYTSFGYNEQVGTIRPSKFDRLTGRLNLTTKTTNWLTLTTSTILSRTTDNDITDNASVARGGVVLSALGTPPTVPKYNTDPDKYGQIAQNPYTGWENPLGAIEGVSNKHANDRLVANIGADVKLWKGLTFQSRFGLDYTNFLGTYFLDPWLTQDGRNQSGNLSQTTSTQSIWLSEQTLSYAKNWGLNHLTALAGWTAQESHFDQTQISATHIDTAYRHETWNEMYARATVKNPATKTVEEWGLMSYLGRITYDYDGKYLVQANLRTDKSSKFAPGNRTATFPSFSAGWRISRENFMRDIDVVNDLKLRVGWGQNGNQEGLGNYEYLSLINIDPTGGTHPATIAPEDLTWETSTQTNIGVDASFFKGRLNFSGDFYVKKTKDVLIRVPLSGQIVPSVLMNRGNMQNIGEEFVISSKNIVGKDFTWTTDFNISFNKNEVTSLGGNLGFLTGYGYIYERGYAVRLEEGYGLGEFYGYQAAGVDPQTGDQLYLTNDGKGVSNSTVKPSDRRHLGSAQPSFVYGMTNILSYKNFDLTIFFQGSQGNKIFNGVRVESEGMKDSRNQSTAILGRWVNPGDVTDIPGIKPYSDDNTQISSRFIENGSYLRFKTITLAYRLSSKWIDRIGLGAASVYITGQNLITITKYTGFDPEVNTYGTDASSDQRNVALGVDYGAYPQAKAFIFGINISLK